MLSRDALDELYDYTSFAWAMIGRTIASMPPEDYARAAPGSGWPAMADCIAHVVDTYQYSIHRILGHGRYDPERAKALRSWEDTQTFRHAVRAHFRRVVDETPDEKLREPFTHQEEGFPPETLTIADVLANILLHERGHHGDISTLFYQLGAQPPPIDYRIYVFAKSHRDMFPSW
jgi:uncharacterized damage-inducible protein DinB